MTRHRDQNRSRTFRGLDGHSCTTPQTSAGRSANRTKRTDDAGGSEPRTVFTHDSVPAFQPPPIDVELDLQTVDHRNELWVRLRGEADLANHEQLHRGLTQAQLEQADAVHLVLNELTFCDLYAFRHLVGFATQVQAKGREFFSHGACPTLKKLARILDVSQELHFV